MREKWPPPRSRDTVRNQPRMIPPSVPTRVAAAASRSGAEQPLGQERRIRPGETLLSKPKLHA